MVRLDDLRRPTHRARLDHVGVERTLHQPLDLAFALLDAAGFFLEHFDEFVANDLAFLLGIIHAFELSEKTVGGVDGIEVKAEFIAQRFLYFLEFVLAQHAIVHEDASQARFAFCIAQRAIDQHRCDGRIHATGERADGASAADLLFHLLDGRIDEALRSPCRLRAANLEDEIP